MRGGLPVELFLGLRYLRSRGSRTNLSLFVWIGVGGVFLGVAALIVVLAVMTGFQDGIRDRIPNVEHFVALEGSRDGWQEYEPIVAQASGLFERPEIAETDLLSINYTSGTTSRPKGVMITHRNAAINVIGTLLHLPMAVGERYLWTLPMFHANGWTYTWTVTAAAGTHICLRRVDPGAVFEVIRRERVRSLCAAPTVLIGLAVPSLARSWAMCTSTVRVVPAG